jgi:hypothetical protein
VWVLIVALTIIAVSLVGWAGWDIFKQDVVAVVAPAPAAKVEPVPNAPAVTPPASPADNRIGELEKQLEKLLKEKEQPKAEVVQTPPAAVPPAASEYTLSPDEAVTKAFEGKP